MTLYCPCCPPTPRPHAHHATDGSVSMTVKQRNIALCTCCCMAAPRRCVGQ